MTHGGDWLFRFLRKQLLGRRIMRNVPASLGSSVLVVDNSFFVKRVPFEFSHSIFVPNWAD